MQVAAARVPFKLWEKDDDVVVVVETMDGGAVHGIVRVPSDSRR